MQACRPSRQGIQSKQCTAHLLHGTSDLAKKSSRARPSSPASWHKHRCPRRRVNIHFCGRPGCGRASIHFPSKASRREQPPETVISQSKAQLSCITARNRTQHGTRNKTLSACRAIHSALASQHEQPQNTIISQSSAQNNAQLTCITAQATFQKILQLESRHAEPTLQRRSAKPMNSRSLLYCQENEAHRGK